jgi:hypothetical protein
MDLLYPLCSLTITPVVEAKRTAGMRGIMSASGMRGIVKEGASVRAQASSTDVVFGNSRYQYMPFPLYVLSFT